MSLIEENEFEFDHEFQKQKKEFDTLMDQLKSEEAIPDEVDKSIKHKERGKRKKRVKMGDEGTDQTHNIEFDLITSINKLYKEMSTKGFFTSLSGLNKTKRAFSSKPKFFKFEKNVNLLTDESTKGQFNSLFPGYWDKFMNREIRLSEKTKRNKIKIFKMLTESMPLYMRSKYRKLVSIICSIFDSLPDCTYRHHEDFEFVNVIENLFFLEEEDSQSDSEASHDMRPDPEFIRMQTDIDILF
jgi:hypothetical protein